MIEITKGLDVPISGVPKMQIEQAPPVRRVALLGSDYQDLKPTMLVAEDDYVSLGQPLAADKRHPKILYTAPAAGKVVAINRGERRAFLSLVIERSGNQENTFPAATEEVEKQSAEEIEKHLLNSGLWTSFRTRPYSKLPAPGSRPAALFITAIDTNPLAADPVLAIAARPAEFESGLQVLRRMTDGNVYLCKHPEAEIAAPEGISIREFAGCHPAGLVGTHIHFLERVSHQRRVWYIGYQDVIAIGHLFRTGRLLPEKIIALGGPAVKNPRLISTLSGACLSELLADQLLPGTNRVISGSVLNGHRAEEAADFLGRYHDQVCVLREDRQRVFLGWAKPGFDQFSIKKVFASALRPRRRLPMTTNRHGSLRAMVPIGAYEKVMPLTPHATWLLRSLLTLDTELAQGLGCLELDEEDLALCSFVCPGKIDYGLHLRQTLYKIEEEG